MPAGRHHALRIGLQKEYPQADVSDLLEQKEKAKAQKQQPVVYEMEPEDKDRSNE